MPTIDISGTGELDDLPTAYAIRVPRVNIASQTKKIHLPQVVLKGTADLANNGEVFPKATFKLRSPHTRILLSPARIDIRDMTLSGQVKTKINSPPGARTSRPSPSEASMSREACSTFAACTTSN